MGQEEINVRNINPTLDVGCLKLTIEPGYLSKIHMDTVLPPIADKIQRGERLTDQELMLLVILPLTKQKKSAQRAALKEIVELAKQIADEDQQLFAISGALTFADKIVDSKYANQVKEWIMMTKVARLFEEEKMAKNAEEAAERERLLKEEEERMQKELEKYDEDYMNDDSVDEAPDHEEEVEDSNESNR